MISSIRCGGSRGKSKKLNDFLIGPRRQQSVWEKLRKSTRQGKRDPSRQSLTLRDQTNHKGSDTHKSDLEAVRGVFSHDYGKTPETNAYSIENNQSVFSHLPLLPFSGLKFRKTRPRKVRMWTRDFIDDSLYNPNYGYFSKEVDIFRLQEPYDYSKISGDTGFLSKWHEDLKEFTQKSNAKSDLESFEHSNLEVSKESSQVASKSLVNKKSKKLPRKVYHRPGRQIWHTPTELFRPFYGDALARYISANYKLSLYPTNDLIIYEMGGGNGTLMLNMLDYLRKNEPDVYSRTQYRIIEISTQLAEKQKAGVKHLAEQSGHFEKVDIINKSIFEWNHVVLEPCYFVALEVFDNFAHDVLRYNNITLKPYQAQVVIDGMNDFSEIYTPDLDYWTQLFLKLRNQIPDYTPCWELGYHPLAQPSLLRRLKNVIWPFKGDFSDKEYIPTRYLQFLYILKKFFPNHQILASDFTHLDKTIAGYCSPVVQTLLHNRMIPVSTYMVFQGFFDIMFPTDFELAAALYEKVCDKRVRVSSHYSFMREWADVKATTTKNGDNPLLSFYKNAAFLHG